MGTGQGVSLFQGKRHDAPLCHCGANSRAHRDVNIIPRGPGSSRLGLHTLRGQAWLSADPAQAGNSRLSSPSPRNLILSGLYFRSDEEDLRVAHII